MSDTLTIKGFAVPGGTAKYDYNSLINVPIDNSLKYEAQSLNPEQIAQVWKNLGLDDAPSAGGGGGTGGSGADGITPHIGANGNWYLGNVDTGVPAAGKTAYQYAQDGGYEGTEVQFAAKLAKEYLPLTGGSLTGSISTTGDITGRWLYSEWLQTTQATNLNSTPSKIAVIGDSGWIHYRKPDEILGDIGATTLSEIQPLLNKKADDFSIEIYNGTPGNPKPVRFASFNYSTCDSENGIAARINLVSGHGNGSSYAFLEEVIIKVNHLGGVEVDNFKYYGAPTEVYDGVVRQYGDIFWLIDETNKIVDFYCLMGQYARLYQTPWKRLTYSVGGTVVQYTSCTVYSNGVKIWANNSDIILMSDLITKLNRTTSVNIADTNYSTLMARGASLNSTETNPAVNGAIAWTYE